MIETTMGELCGFREGQNPFNDYMGIRDIRIDDEGNYFLIMTVTEKMLNPFGKIHGAVLFALCDSAAGSFLDSSKRSSVTLSSSISFYRTAALGDVLTAQVHERKSGQTIAVLEVEVVDQNGKRVADASFQMFRKEKDK